MSAEIEHGWNDNHHADDRLNMTRDSEEKEKEERNRFSFLLIFQKTTTNALVI
jgi:hypothetical protein